MIPKESAIEKYFTDRVKEVFRVETRKFKSRSNDPDRLVLLPGGIAVFVELKRPDEEPREGQLREHKRLRERGFPVYVASTKEEVDRVIEGMQILRGYDDRLVCEHCGGRLMPLPSKNIKRCDACGINFSWHLEKGQKPLICAQR